MEPLTGLPLLFECHSNKFPFNRETRGIARIQSRRRRGHRSKTLRRDTPTFAHALIIPDSDILLRCMTHFPYSLAIYIDGVTIMRALLLRVSQIELRNWILKVSWENSMWKEKHWGTSLMDRSLYRRDFVTLSFDKVKKCRSGNGFLGYLAIYEKGQTWIKSSRCFNWFWK